MTQSDKNKASEPGYYYHPLKVRMKARDDWDVNMAIFVDADIVINKYRDSGCLPIWLNKALHEISWHLGLHTPRWICDNPELVAKFAIYDRLCEPDKEKLRSDYSASIFKLMRDQA